MDPEAQKLCRESTVHDDLRADTPAAQLSTAKNRWASTNQAIDGNAPMIEIRESHITRSKSASLKINTGCEATELRPADPVSPSL
jgi:hypothetical protein